MNRLFLLLLAPLASACAMDDAVLQFASGATTATTVRAVANNNSEPPLPLNPDASAEAKLTQQYANALVNQLNVEREQRRRELAEMKRRAQMERRLAELARRKPQQAKQERQPIPAKPAILAPTALASAPAGALPANPQAQPPAQTLGIQTPEFESTAGIPLPKPLRPERAEGTRRQPEPVLFDPESRKGG
ncbi:hypothetical protein [Ferrovibrio sp.]|uniref:hypothetical protein n=1 Tax=Ferrovibrio sp. TaxID=1917215 RepID=UPI003D29DF3D